MNVQQQIAKLESLLARIQRNAGKARPATDGARAARVGHAAEPAAAEEPIAEPPEAVAYAEARAPVENVSAKPTVPPVAEAASAVEPAEVEELDMSDAEIVEIAVDVTMEESVEASPPPLANELAEEPEPESAPRPATQAAGEEAELEPPVKTPPPESGRQVVAAPVGISGELQLEGSAASQGLEADMSGGPISKAPPGEPTAAQLGETVELDGSDSPPARIELLAAPMSAPIETAPPDDLELSLPQRGFGGGYDAELAPPSRAAEDLARHRDRGAKEEAPPASLTSPGDVPASLGAAPPEGLVSPPAVEPASSAPIIVERPHIGERPVVEMRATAAPTIPATFLELLDASLSIDV